MDRIKNLEQSQKSTLNKLKEVFTKVEEIEKKCVQFDLGYEHLIKSTKELMGRVDCLVDKLLVIENKYKSVSDMSHSHKIIR